MRLILKRCLYCSILSLDIVQIIETFSSLKTNDVTCSSFRIKLFRFSLISTDQSDFREARLSNQVSTKKTNFRNFGPVRKISNARVEALFSLVGNPALIRLSSRRWSIFLDCIPPSDISSPPSLSLSFSRYRHRTQPRAPPPRDRSEFHRIDGGTATKTARDRNNVEKERKGSIQPTSHLLTLTPRCEVTPMKERGEGPFSAAACPRDGK